MSNIAIRQSSLGPKVVSHRQRGARSSAGRTIRPSLGHARWRSEGFRSCAEQRGPQSLHDLREERVCDFGNYESEDAALPGDQGSRLGVRVISKFVNYLPYPLGKLGIHGGNPVNGTRYRGLRLWRALQFPGYPWPKRSTARDTNTAENTFTRGRKLA